MANKVFNNEKKSNITLSTPFYGRMTSGGSLPGPLFKSGELKNNSIDYGNQYQQKITSGMVNVYDKKQGIGRK